MHVDLEQLEGVPVFSWPYKDQDSVGIGPETDHETHILTLGLDLPVSSFPSGSFSQALIEIGSIF